MKNDCIRINLTQPPDWVAACKQQAACEELSLSEWLYYCGAANLDEGLADTLQPRPAIGRPKKGKGNE